MSSEDLQKFFYQEYDLSLTKEEAFECYESLNHLAKAIIRYFQLVEEGVND